MSVAIDRGHLLYPFAAHTRAKRARAPAYKSRRVLPWRPQGERSWSPASVGARSIGAGIALGLAEDGWDLALGYWRPYDDRIGLQRAEDDVEQIAQGCQNLGTRVDLVPGDLASSEEPARLVRAAAARGDLRGLVMSHCESVDSSVLDTSVESCDRHFAVNARASWLLIKAFAEQLPAASTSEVVAHPAPARVWVRAVPTEPHVLRRSRGAAPRGLH